jgi:hypothetical protein
MITINKGLSGSYFSATIPDISYTISGTKSGVEMSVDGTKIYSEILYPMSGVITLTDLTNLLTSYARQKLKVSLAITITEIDSGDAVSDTAQMSASIIYCKADIINGTEDEDAGTFCDAHFLSVLMGSKTTSLGRLEYLHYLGTDAATATASYSDGTTATFTPPAVQGNDVYTTIDVSPNRFTTDGKTLVSYTVTAGNRAQKFVIDLDQPDAAPVMLFVNSFGVEELLYCTGKHKVAPNYTRSSAYIERYKRNYKIEELRKFSADTGYLTVAEQNWADELFRSDKVRVVNFKDGSPVVGKEITITDSKSEVDNLDETMARFTFDYQYAQDNHNVVDLSRAGRIFDNTFDNTFN